MIICGSYTFEFSVNKDVKKIQNNNDESIIPTYLLTYLLTSIVQILKLILNMVGR